jgi:polysaccharide export outer membrane protein
MHTSRSYYLSSSLCCLLLAALLGGCGSTAPMQRQSKTGAVGGGAPPTQLITEELIQAERKLREQRANVDIGQLVVLNPPPYKIDAGDVLSIIVWDHPELTGPVAPVTTTTALVEQGTAGMPSPGFVVDHEGRVQFPFAGRLKLAGMTEDEARNLLVSRLAKYIAHPSVTLRVQSYRSKRIYVDGEVKSPGLQAINDIPMSLLEGLNRAGGLLPTADQSRIVLERGDVRYKIDLRELVQKGINPGTLMLAPATWCGSSRATKARCSCRAKWWRQRR